MASPVFLCMGLCCLSRFVSLIPNSHTCVHTPQNPKASIIACLGLSFMSKSVPDPQPPELTHTQIHISASTRTPTHKLTTTWLLLSLSVLARLCVQLSFPTSPAHSLLALLGGWEPAGLVLQLTVWRRNGIYHMSLLRSPALGAPGVGELEIILHPS